MAASSTQPNTPGYTFEAVGRECMVRFVVDDDSPDSQAWCAGEITGWRVKDGDVEHHISYEDGEKRWHDLDWELSNGNCLFFDKERTLLRNFSPATPTQRIIVNIHSNKSLRRQPPSEEQNNPVRYRERYREMGKHHCSSLIVSLWLLWVYQILHGSEQHHAGKVLAFSPSPPFVNRQQGSLLVKQNPIRSKRVQHISRATTDETGELGSLLGELSSSFDYEGRMEGSPEEGHRCGFVTVLGAPNMGKSTLMNALLEEDLCIATSRPQTTRHAILGILSTPKCQVCLVDTPGVIEDPAYKLQEGMMEAVMGAFYDSDILLVVSDLFSTPIPDDKLFAKVQSSTKTVVVAINKVDLSAKVNPEAESNQGKTVTVEEAIASWRGLLPDALAILPMSASDGTTDPGVQALKQILTGGPDVPSAIRNLGRPISGMFPPGIQFIGNEDVASLLPVSPPLYDQDLLTDRTDRFVASELIRSSLFETLKKELPYCCEVRVHQFKEATESNNLIRIHADILVERDSQKVIVIGKNGEQVKAVGIAARKKLEQFFQTQIGINLRVKVDKDWRKKESKLQEYGYLKKKKKQT